MIITLTKDEADKILKAYFRTKLDTVEITIEIVGVSNKLRCVTAIRNLLIANKKIDAVKYLKAVTNLGLRESKDIVDIIEKGIGNDKLFEMFDIINPDKI